MALPFTVKFCLREDKIFISPLGPTARQDHQGEQALLDEAVHEAWHEATEVTKREKSFRT
jgi:hypothetical protein